MFGNKFVFCIIFFEIWKCIFLIGLLVRLLFICMFLVYWDEEGGGLYYIFGVLVLVFGFG